MPWQQQVSGLTPVGVGLYLMSDDEGVKVKFDAKKHNKELLLKILADLQLEYYDEYLNLYHVMVRMTKDKGAVPQETREKLLETSEKMTQATDAYTFKRHKVDEGVFNEMREKYGNDR